ncbi:MAG: hydrolase [Herbinix sp.]|jgi:ADP-ribose pyrophosphatase YjhB (NUDIX family)|nr:hydrolase [Herbinix sp.]
MSIRNAAKALIIKDDKILLNKCKNSTGYYFGEIHPENLYYDLPGGGQNQYETIEEAVIRECLEETGYSVIVKRLVALYEEIMVDAELSKFCPDYVHKIYFIFLCHVESEDLKSITEIDIDQISTEWINIKEISSIKLHPSIIKDNLVSILNSDDLKFMGSRKI